MQSVEGPKDRTYLQYVLEHPGQYHNCALGGASQLSASQPSTMIVSSLPTVAMIFYEVLFFVFLCGRCDLLRSGEKKEKEEVVRDTKTNAVPDGAVMSRS